MQKMISGTLMGGTIFVGMIMMLTACSKDVNKEDDSQGDIPFVKSFIQSYADTPTQDKVKVAIQSGVPTTTSYQNVSIEMRVVEDADYGVIHSLWGSRADGMAWTEKEQTNAKKFDSLAKAHNDTGYDRETLIFVTKCLYRQTKSIHVVSDTDYDASHPAGTPLDDILTITFNSAEDYLKSGYKALDSYLGQTTCGMNDLEGRPVKSTQLRESLAEFNQIQRKLIEFGFVFTPNIAPDQTSTHRFTVTYTNEDGVVLTGTTDPITIQI